jgi:hypothetical protein
MVSGHWDRNQTHTGRPNEVLAGPQWCPATGTGISYNGHDILKYWIAPQWCPATGTGIRPGAVAPRGDRTRASMVVRPLGPESADAATLHEPHEGASMVSGHWDRNQLSDAPVLASSSSPQWCAATGTGIGVGIALGVHGCRWGDELVHRSKFRNEESEPEVAEPTQCEWSVNRLREA